MWSEKIMWLLPVLGLCAGVVLGIWLPLEIPVAYSRYIAVAVLVILDGILAGLVQGLNENFDPFSFLSGTGVTFVFALLLVYIGEHLGVELYLAVLLALGFRILNSVSSIHSLTVHKFKRRSCEKREK
jgi:small basic protein